MSEALSSNSLGYRLKAFRSARGLTQKDLGDLLGLSQETITNYERGGRHPKPSALRDIARLLGTSVDELLAPPPTIETIESSTKRTFSAEECIAELREGDPARAYDYCRAWKHALGFRLEDFLVRALVPVLEGIGELWQAGEMSVADEHLASEKIREIATLVAAESPPLPQSAAQPSADKPRGHRTWLGLCAPGEKHYLALYFTALILRHRGWKTIFLGTSVPLSDLVDAIELHEPEVVAIAVTIEENIEGLLGYVRKLRETYGRSKRIIAGGSCLRQAPTALGKCVDGIALNIEEGLDFIEAGSTIKS